MKSPKLGATALLIAAAPGALAFSISPELFYQPGNNAFFTMVPGPGGDRETLQDGVAMVRTDAQLAQAVTTYSGLPAGSLSQSAGITVLVPEWFGGIVEALNAQSLTVGPAGLAAIRQYHPGVFTDVFGVYRANVFGFAGFNFLEGFGIPGTPISFTYDRTHLLYANRFLTSGAIEAGYRVAYVSTPLVRVVPDAGSAGVLLAFALAALAGLRRVRGN